MKVSKHVKLFSVGFAMVLTSACGAKSDSKDDNSSTDAADGAGGSGSTSNKVGSATNIADLKLAGALAINLPEAFGGTASGTSLRLLAGKKSQEACMMGDTIKQSVSSLSEVAGFFCHMEVEKDRMKFGTKYKIIAGGNEFARIFVDNSQAASGKLTIGFCQADTGEGSHRQLITLDTITDTGPKGTIISDGSGTYQGSSMTYARSTTFDMSVAGIVSLISKDKNTQGTSSTFVREVSLDLKQSGQSSLKLAHKGNQTFNNSPVEFFDRGIAYLSGDKGSALFQHKGDHGGTTYTFTNRAHFSKTGDVLTSADVGADLQPATTAIPAYLPSDFSPDAPSGWVGSGCPDFAEEITIDPQAGGHAACNQDHSNNGMDCWDSNKYEQSSEQAVVQ